MTSSGTCSRNTMIRTLTTKKRRINQQETHSYQTVPANSPTFKLYLMEIKPLDRLGRIFAIKYGFIVLYPLGLLFNAMAVSEISDIPASPVAILVPVLACSYSVCACHAQSLMASSAAARANMLARDLASSSQPLITLEALSRSNNSEALIWPAI